MFVGRGKLFLLAQQIQCTYVCEEIWEEERKLLGAWALLQVMFKEIFFQAGCIKKDFHNWKLTSFPHFKWTAPVKRSSSYGFCCPSRMLSWNEWDYSESETHWRPFWIELKNLDAVLCQYLKFPQLWIFQESCCLLKPNITLPGYNMGKLDNYGLAHNWR